MRKIFLFAALLLVSLEAWSAAKAQVLRSPDNRTIVTVDGFKYSVIVDGKRMIAPSAIGMTLTDGRVYGGDAKLVKASRQSADQIIRTPLYRKSSVRDNYNQLTLRYKEFDLIFRAYNEGIAYRFVSKSKTSFGVKSETADFSFPDDWKMYAAYCENDEAKSLEGKTLCGFENTYEYVPISQFNRENTAFLPLAVEAANGYKIVITESDLFDFPGLELYNSNGDATLEAFHVRWPSKMEGGGCYNSEGLVKGREDFIAKDCKPGAAFPWRVIQIAREDSELPLSDLVYKLATPSKEGEDWSWVKPGKVAYDWWCDWNLYGVGFRAGTNTATYKYFIDFASGHGLEYVIFDAGWYDLDKADMMAVNPDLNLEEIVSYANARNVGLILWAGFWPLQKDMEGIFAHYSKMGFKGFKVDFLSRDDQEMVRFNTRCAELGAKYKMILDFHGTYKPTGLQRTYPNVINFEGVHEQEHMKARKEAGLLDYDVTMPFIRMISGPVDYLAGAMMNAAFDNFEPVNSEPMSQGTRCHQIATYIVYDAPFSMMSDSPSNYLKEEECAGFIAGIPTVWDETRILGGRMKEFITTARRSGDNWWIGSMTNWDIRDMTIDLSFLPSGEYRMTIFRDGANADRIARDYASEERTVSSYDKIKIHLAPGGGWAAKLEKL